MREIDKNSDHTDYHREKYVNQLSSTTESEQVHALLAIAFNDPDWRWCQALFLRYAQHPQAGVRGIAILCFGHIARIHQQLETEKVLPIVKEALYDADSFVKGHAVSALDDIQQFIFP